MNKSLQDTEKVRPTYQFLSHAFFHEIVISLCFYKVTLTYGACGYSLYMGYLYNCDVQGYFCICTCY